MTDEVDDISLAEETLLSYDVSDDTLESAGGRLPPFRSVVIKTNCYGFVCVGE